MIHTPPSEVMIAVMRSDFFTVLLPSFPETILGEQGNGTLFSEDRVTA
jgi:hypothetical protein